MVKPDGMSFNGISPMYRELLLKLAMSMSKDEIFIRSKNIMNEEKVRKRELLIMGGSRLLNQMSSKTKVDTSSHEQASDSGHGSAGSPDPVHPASPDPPPVQQPSKKGTFGGFFRRAKKGLNSKSKKSHPPATVQVQQQMPKVKCSYW